MHRSVRNGAFGIVLLTGTLVWFISGTLGAEPPSDAPPASRDPHAAPPPAARPSQASKESTGHSAPSRGTAHQFTTEDCLACHDGIIAGQQGGRTGQHTWQVAGQRIVMEHPYNVKYAPNDRNRLRPLNAGIEGTAHLVEDLLVAGKLQCTSCHAMYRSRAWPGTALLRTELSWAPNVCMTCHKT